MSQNNVSLELSNEQLTQAAQATTTLEQALAGLVSLAPADRRRLVKMGQKSEVFCRQTLRVLAQNPQVVPPGLGLAEAQADLLALDQLAPLLDRLQRLAERGRDTEMALGADVMDAALEGSSDMYRTANDGFRSASKVIDAVDEGAMMATRGRAADNVPRFGAMAAAEQGAARTGYGDRLLAQLETMASPTANRAKPLLSPKRAMEADAMATDPRLYSDRLGRENTMWETQNRALGGSRTADNLADQSAMNGLSGEVMQAGKAAANLQFGDMVQKVAGALGPILKGQNEPTRMLIAQALMSSNAGQVLVPAIAQATKSAGVRRILEALLRQPMREGGEALAQ